MSKEQQMDDEAQQAKAEELPAEEHVLRLMAATKRRLEKIDQEIGVQRDARRKASARMKALLNEQQRLLRVMRATEPRKSRTTP